LQGFGAEKFSINNVTGQLFVAECGLTRCLDHESRRRFELTVVARDGGGRQATADLRIAVRDVNDNQPVFEFPEYRRSVAEGDSAITPPLFVVARDLDGAHGMHDSPNGRVTYSIVSGNTADEAFSIDPVSGFLSIARTLSGSETDTGRFR
jgi:protocadherin-15